MFDSTAIINKLLKNLKEKKYAHFLENNEKTITTAGLMGLQFIIPILVLITGVVIGIKNNSFISILFAITYAFTCFFLHFTAIKMLPYVSSLIEKSPTKLSSQAILDVNILGTGLIGFISILVGTYFAIKTDSLTTFLIGLFVFFFCEYMVAMFLTPKESLNISIEKETTPAREFIGFASFSVKAAYRLVPIAFGTSVIIAICQLLHILFYTSEAEFYHFFLTLVFTLIPLFGYILFLSYYFLLDLSVAFLSIPEKLGELVKKK